MKLKKISLLGALGLTIAGVSVLASCGKEIPTTTHDVVPGTTSTIPAPGTTPGVVTTPTPTNPTVTPTPTTPVEEKFTVRFETGIETEIKPQEIIKGQKVAEPEALIRDGYDFDGWYLDEAYTNKYDFSTPVEKNIVLYAKWNKKASVEALLTIEYHIGDEVINDVISNPKLVEFFVPELQAYNFLGYVDQDGKDVTIDQIRNLTITENKTIVLTAKFDKEIEYVTVTFQSEGKIETYEIIKGEKLDEDIENPKKDGYKFVGWFESETDEEAFDLTGAITTDVTLIARFKEINTIKTTHFDNYLKKDGPLTEKALPSLGNPKVLVIPVNLDNSNKTDEVRNSIAKVFSGTEEDTGWESVKTYYQKSSYGKLNFEFELTNWFTPSKTAEEYNRDYLTGDTLPSDDILEEALTYFDSQYDYSQYDLDNDGYIDSVWLIYNSPVDYENDDSLYWAYTTSTESTTTFDGKKSSCYAFAGTDFITPNQDDANYDVSDLTYDAHTFIHETGHLLGLDDYYDYDSAVGATGGLYGADMMDYNIGDHGPINKLLLGWIDPCVVTETTTVTISDFSTSGNVLLVTNKSLTSIYDEYFLIEFYNGEGLNAHDMPICDYDANDNMINAIGVRVTHVNAVKKTQEEIDNDYSEVYYTGFKYNNSETDKLFIDTLSQADVSIYDKYFADQELLFTPTSNQLGTDVYTNYKMHDGKKLFFKMTVDSMDENSATVTITFNSLAGSGSEQLPWI